MRTAIVHYWILNRRGGEAVLDALCRLLPGADILTLFYDPEGADPAYLIRPVKSSFLNPLRRWRRWVLPLLPLALEKLDLRAYDLVISSACGPTGIVRVPPAARHLCYCQGSTRYPWNSNSAGDSVGDSSFWSRAFLAPFATYLRLWDSTAAARVDEFIANSQDMRRRIRRSFGKGSEVIYPPVAVDRFYWKAAGDYYLAVSGLFAGRRLDSAVRVCALTHRRLRVVGEGPEYRRLRSLAGDATEFCGCVSAEELQELYAHCRALLIPGESDFDVTAVEALASGKPVIALGRGGAPESVPLQAPRGGVLYDHAADEDLAAALDRFEQIEPAIHPLELRHWAQRFSEAVFLRKMRAVLTRGDPQFAPLLTGTHAV